MNIRRIKALRTFIAKLPPKAVYMPNYIECDRADETLGQAAKDTCGTAACIAGWTALRFHKDRKARINLYGDSLISDRTRHIAHVAQELLGLTNDEADELFLGYWTTTNKPLPYIKKHDVLRELDHIINTGEI